jgi:hypothetical protein
MESFFLPGGILEGSDDEKDNIMKSSKDQDVASNSLFFVPPLPSVANPWEEPTSSELAPALANLEPLLLRSSSAITKGVVSLSVGQQSNTTATAEEFPLAGRIDTQGASNVFKPPPGFEAVAPLSPFRKELLEESLIFKTPDSEQYLNNSVEPELLLPSLKNRQSAEQPTLIIDDTDTVDSTAAASQSYFQSRHQEADQHTIDSQSNHDVKQAKSWASVAVASTDSNAVLLTDSRHGNKNSTHSYKPVPPSPVSSNVSATTVPMIIPTSTSPNRRKESGRTKGVARKAAGTSSVAAGENRNQKQQSKSRSNSMDTETVVDDAKTKQESDKAVAFQDLGNVQSNKGVMTMKQSTNTTVSAATAGGMQETVVAARTTMGKQSKQRRQNSREDSEHVDRSNNNAMSLSGTLRASSQNVDTSTIKTGARYSMEWMRLIGGVAQVFLWGLRLIWSVGEVLWPALASFSLVFACIAKALIISALVLANTFKYAAAEVEQSDTGSFFCYLVFYVVPNACDGIMSLCSLPHFTPHVVSSVALFFLCHPTSTSGNGSSSNGGGGNKKRIHRSRSQIVDRQAEAICTFLLQLSRYSIPFDLFLEGFGQPNTNLMTLDVSSRLLLAYMLSLLRANLVLSPVVWMCWSIQVILSVHLPLSDQNPNTSKLMECLLLLIGLASLRLCTIVQAIEVTSHKDE